MGRGGVWGPYLRSLWGWGLGAVKAKLREAKASWVLRLTHTECLALVGFLYGWAKTVSLALVDNRSHSIHSQSVLGLGTCAVSPPCSKVPRSEPCKFPPYCQKALRIVIHFLSPMSSNSNKWVKGFVFYLLGVLFLVCGHQHLRLLVQKSE